jgi:hypothetical protein
MHIQRSEIWMNLRRRIVKKTERGRLKVFRTYYMVVGNNIGFIGRTR